MRTDVAGHRRTWPRASVVGADAVLAVWLAVGLFLCLRCLLGGMTRSLSVAEHIMVGIGVVSLAAGCRHCIAWCWPSYDERVMWLAVAGGSLLALFAFSIPVAPPSGVLLMWAIVLGLETGAAWPRLGSWLDSRSPLDTSGRSASPSGTVAVGERRANFDPVATATATLPPSAAMAPPPDEQPGGLQDQLVLQQITRSRSAEAGETLCGWMLVEFAAGTCVRSCHLSFCPPLASIPEMHLEVESEVEAEAKVAQIATYGARVDVSLARQAEVDTQVRVEFYADERVSHNERGG